MDAGFVIDNSVVITWAILNLAMRLGLPLATLDQRLIAAAQQVEVSLVAV